MNAVTTFGAEQMAIHHSWAEEAWENIGGARTLSVYTEKVKEGFRCSWSFAVSEV